MTAPFAPLGKRVRYYMGSNPQNALEWHFFWQRFFLGYRLKCAHAVSRKFKAMHFYTAYGLVDA